jgi:hypothetical protein
MPPGGRTNDEDWVEILGEQDQTSYISDLKARSRFHLDTTPRCGRPEVNQGSGDLPRSWDPKRAARARKGLTQAQAGLGSYSSRI